MFLLGHLLAVGSWDPESKKAEIFNSVSWTTIDDYPYSGPESSSKLL